MSKATKLLERALPKLKAHSTFCSNKARHFPAVWRDQADYMLELVSDVEEFLSDSRKPRPSTRTTAGTDRPIRRKVSA